jgi:hypothetical protein
MTIAKVEEGLKGGSLPKKKLDLPMTLDKDTLKGKNIPCKLSLVNTTFFGKEPSSRPSLTLLLYLKVYWYTKCPCQVSLANLTFLRHFTLITPMHE